MKQKKTILILATVIAVFTSLLCNAQNKIKSAIYDIHAMGMDVGTITVNQEINGDKVFVEAISEVEVRIIFKIKMKYIQTCMYLNGVLQESLLNIYKKDKVNSTTRLTKKGEGYTLDKDGEISYVKDVINFSGSLLWFHEPQDGTEMYFEINGKKTVVKDVGDHEYSITDPHNGNKNEYTFKNDILKQAIIKHTMANVYLNLQEEETPQTTYSN